MAHLIIDIEEYEEVKKEDKIIKIRKNIIAGIGIGIVAFAGGTTGFAIGAITNKLMGYNVKSIIVTIILGSIIVPQVMMKTTDVMFDLSETINDSLDQRKK